MGSRARAISKKIDPSLVGKISPEQAMRIIEADAVFRSLQQDPAVVHALTRFELARSNLSLAIAEAERDSGLKLAGFVVKPDGTVSRPESES